MQLIKESKVWYKLWSMRLLLGAIGFQLLDLTWLLFEHMETRHVFAAIAILLTIGATIARMVKQNNITPKE